MAHTPNPLSSSFTAGQAPLSKSIHLIAGIKCSVYGIDEIPSKTSTVSVLWLLHPRLSDQDQMEPVAMQAITEWNRRLVKSHSTGSPGLIAVSFDQRNHGTRLLDKTSNEAWRGGNPRHAQDMFSSYHGTALDTSQLITYLPAYAFPHEEKDITSHMVIGVSLGGHAAWHCILQDPRITTAVSVIGCADYTRLMMHRAEKSKLETWKSSNPPGATFLGSKDFPKALQQAIDKYDPAGLLMGEMVAPGGSDYSRVPTEREIKRLVPLMRDHLQGKRVFQLSGGSDKLVPHACSEPVIGWLQRATTQGGWFAGHGVLVKDEVYQGAGHEMTPKMAADAVEFLMVSLEAQSQGHVEAKM